MGTFAADAALAQGADNIIARFKYILNLEGVKSVTKKACSLFNKHARKKEATNDVYYQTYSSYQEEKSVFLPFQISWKTIRNNEGDNDGLVSVKSQKWESKLVSGNGKAKKIDRHEFPIRADHMDQIGWWNLNEIHKAGWWNLKALREKNKHEEIIKDVYLKIVKDINEKFSKKDSPTTNL
jgi:hypothetical protein